MYIYIYIICTHYINVILSLPHLETAELSSGVLVSYAHENGSCCAVGIVHRAYQVLEEYTVLLRDGSKEEVPLAREGMKRDVCIYSIFG